MRGADADTRRTMLRQLAASSARLVLASPSARAALSPARSGALASAARVVPAATRHLCAPAVSASSSSNAEELFSPRVRYNRASRKARLLAALEVARTGGEFVVKPLEPSTVPGPCFAVMSTLKDKGPLQTKELFAAVEEKYPGALKSVNHLKQKVLKSALVNKVMRVRQNGSIHKIYWSPRKKGQIRMTIARRARNRSKEILHSDSRRNKKGERVKPKNRWPPGRWYVRPSGKKAYVPPPPVYRPLPGQAGYVEGAGAGQSSA